MTSQETTMNNLSGNEKSLQNGRARVDAGIRERVDHARDVVETVREKAEVAFREKPYLLPVAAGAVGFGLGMVFGSKIMRFVVFTAGATILTETLGGEIKRMGRDFMEDLQDRLDDDEGEGEGV
jgi:hypothetical protein